METLRIELSFNGGNAVVVNGTQDYDYQPEETSTMEEPEFIPALPNPWKCFDDMPSYIKRHTQPSLDSHGFDLWKQDQDIHDYLWFLYADDYYAHFDDEAILNILRLGGLNVDKMDQHTGKELVGIVREQLGLIDFKRAMAMKWDDEVRVQDSNIEDEALKVETAILDNVGDGLCNLEQYLEIFNISK